MQEIGPKFDMFFLVLYMTDWVRLAASTVCSIFAVFAYCKRYYSMPFVYQTITLLCESIEAYHN